MPQKKCLFFFRSSATLFISSSPTCCAQLHTNPQLTYRHSRIAHVIHGLKDMKCHIWSSSAWDVKWGAVSTTFGGGASEIPSAASAALSPMAYEKTKKSSCVSFVVALFARFCVSHGFPTKSSRRLTKVHHGSAVRRRCVHLNQRPKTSRYVSNTMIKIRYD